MAQVCGGTTFDIEAQHKHELALKILSRAADVWATGLNSLSTDSIIAVLLRIYSSKCNLRTEIRSFDSWLSLVATIERELEFFSLANSVNVAEILTTLRAEISEAEKQWKLGNPEQPPTAHVLNAVEHILFVHKLITRPASPKFPKTILAN